MNRRLAEFADGSEDALAAVEAGPIQGFLNTLQSKLKQTRLETDFMQTGETANICNANQKASNTSDVCIRLVQ